MEPASYFSPEGDVAYIRVRSTGGPLRSHKEEWGLRDVDDEEGDLVGLEIWEASSRLPAELIAALPHLDGRDLTIQRQPA